jgi:hypothetical protein
MVVDTADLSFLFLCAAGVRRFHQQVVFVQEYGGFLQLGKAQRRAFFYV